MNKIPATLAVRQLRQQKIEFEPYFYAYEERGGTAVAARELKLDEHQVIKTLLFEDQERNPLVVLMHGDKEVSGKSLARQLALKSLHPCSPERVPKLSGYQAGGVSPFGMLKKMPVYVEKSILDLPCLFINGGKRGFLVKITADDLVYLLEPVPVEAAY